MIQASLFSSPEPAWKSEKRAAMKQVEENASDVWSEGATRLLREYCVTHSCFMAYELTLLLRERGFVTPSDRALGPVIVKAAKAGWLRKSNDYRPNPLAHGCPSPVWISNLYEYGDRQ